MPEAIGNWAAITAIASIALAGSSVIGVGAAIYAGIYTKKAHEVSKNQRQIENSLRYVKMFKDIFNIRIKFREQKEHDTYQSYLHYYQEHPQEFRMSASGWPVRITDGDTQISVIFVKYSKC